MKRFLFSVLITVLAEALPPSLPPQPKTTASQGHRSEIVCASANDGEPFCTVFYPSGEYCTTYQSGY